MNRFQQMSRARVALEAALEDSPKYGAAYYALHRALESIDHAANMAEQEDADTARRQAEREASDRNIRYDVLVYRSVHLRSLLDMPTGILAM